MSYSEQLLDAIETQNFSQQDELLKKAIDNDKPEVLASLAENLTGLGFTNLSKKIYRFLIAKFPKEDLFKVYLAEILLNDGQEDDGLALLYEVKPDSDAYVESLLTQADYYQTNGLLETAKSKLLQALKINPDEDIIKFGLAELAYLNGEYEDALSFYRDLVTRQKNIGEINLNQRLFQTLAKSGRYEQAKEVIELHSEDLIDIDSKYQAGIVMLSVGDFDKSIAYLNDVLDQDSDYVNAYPFLAEAYEQKRDYEQALRICQAGLVYNELDPILYTKGASAAHSLGDYQTEEDLLSKGLEKLPDNVDLRLQLSNLYLRKGQDKDNLDLFSKLESSEIEPQAHWNMALSYENIDQFDKAREQFWLAYPDFQNNSDFLKAMSEFFFSQEGATKEATKLHKRYLKIAAQSNNE